MSLKFFVHLSLLLRIYNIYTYSFLCGTSVVDCLIVISPFKCWYKTLHKHLYMFAFSLFLTDSWYIIFYLFIVFASFLCSMYLLLCGNIAFKCLNKALGYFCTFLHAYTSLHLTPHNYTHWLHQFYRVCPSSTNVAGWVVVRVTVTKSTGERNKWQDRNQIYRRAE